jgi:hypothetical protein
MEPLMTVDAGQLNFELDVATQTAGLPKESAELVQALQPPAEEAAGVDPAPVLADQAPRTRPHLRGPIVPVSWAQKPPEVIPDEQAKAGRPKPQRRFLSVQDLDLSVVYIQRRAREVQSFTRAQKPTSEHASHAVKSAIQDSIRRLAMLLPVEQRSAVEESLSSFGPGR